jgi:hypothetical protein
MRMAKYPPGIRAATEAQRLTFGWGKTILIESERIKRQTDKLSPILACCTAQ